MSDESYEVQAGSGFPGTRWSLVASARADSGQAVEELCSIYWRPIYGFLRQSGYSRSDAEDLTQSFLIGLVQDEGLSRVSRDRGKLRSFLLGALKRHLVSERRRASRLKRGGGEALLPLAASELDFEQAEHQYVAQPGHEESPDRVFDQRWVLTLLERAHRRVRDDYFAAGKGMEYDLLKAAVTTTEDLEVGEIARKLKVKEASVRVLVHRLRKNFRAAFKEEIAQTVGSRAEVEEEFRKLLEVFS